MPAYVPPALRNRLAQQAQAGGSQQQCARIWTVKLCFTSVDSFPLSTCPQNLLPAPADADQSEVQSRTFELPSEASSAELSELLAWFSVACTTSKDAKACLEFPPSLTKEDRKLVHSLAQKLLLPTQSEGVEEQRYISVYSSAQAHANDNHAGDKHKRKGKKAVEITPEVRKHAGQIYAWCQDEGGEYWKYSRNELEALLSLGQGLPAALQKLVDTRSLGQQLHALIEAGQEQDAIQFLDANPKTAYMANEKGAYPSHRAAVLGQQQLMAKLMVMPGVLRQCDKKHGYCTPLQTAEKAGQKAIAEMLKQYVAVQQAQPRATPSPRMSQTPDGARTPSPVPVKERIALGPPMEGAPGATRGFGRGQGRLSPPGHAVVPAAPGSLTVVEGAC